MAAKDKDVTPEAQPSGDAPDQATLSRDASRSEYRPVELEGNPKPGRHVEQVLGVPSED